MKASGRIAVLAVAACAALSAHADLNVGYAKYDITPPLGTSLAGYGTIRPADGVLSPIDAIAVAFSDGTNKAVVVVADLLTLWGYYDLFRKAIAEGTDLDPQAVFVTCTHTHTGPDVGWCHYGRKFEDFSKASVYTQSLRDKLVSVSRLALADLAPAKLSTARAEAKGISFIRRYRMKDGNSATNPGVGNPDIVGPIGEADDEVQVARIDRPGRDAVAIVNFQCHPDTIGGRKISGDWPSVVRDTVERALPNVKCVFLNGAQGDTNHICTDKSRIALPLGDRRYHVHMGRVVAGAVIGTWDVCVPARADKVGYGIENVRVKTSRGTPKEVDEANRILALKTAGRMSDIPGTGRVRDANVARAWTAKFLADGPDYFVFPLSAVTIGDALAFAGFPGEPFTFYGTELKKRSPFAMTMPVCLVNDMFGYIPDDASLNATGYTTQGALFAKGLEETVLGGHVRQLRRLVERCR